MGFGIKRKDKTMDTKDVTSIHVGNADIQKIVVGGGIVWQGNTVPGPTTLRGGNLQAGFYGECPTSEFITGDELAKMIGLTAGTSQYSNEPWLKFSYLGKVEFVAKKPFRHSISWTNINAVNAVFGNRTVEIKGKTYKVRLMKGKTEGKQNDYLSPSGDICKGSEWNKLMLPIHKNAPSSWKYHNNVSSPTANWNVGYKNADLVTHYDNGEGSYSWCQEYGSNRDNRLRRGGQGVSYSPYYSPSDTRPHNGWRPVLELLE